MKLAINRGACMNYLHLLFTSLLVSHNAFLFMNYISYDVFCYWHLKRFKFMKIEVIYLARGPRYITYHGDGRNTRFVLPVHCNKSQTQIQL